MTRRRLFLYVLAVTMILGLVAGGAMSAPKVQIFKLGHVNPLGAPADKTARLFADLIKERTNGEIVIEVYEAESLGVEKALVQGLKLGTIDFAFTDATYLSSVYQPIGVFDCPYIYRDWDHYKAVAHSEIFQQVAADCEKATGIRPLALTLFGRRHVVTNTPFTTPEEAKGLLIRTPEAELAMDFARAVGGTPTPIAYGEAYLALRQGVADGAENPLTGIWDMKWYEVCKYVVLTQHTYGNEVLSISAVAAKKLTKEQLDIVKQAAQEAADWELNYQMEIEAQMTKDLEAKGLTMVEIPDLEPFRQFALPYLENKYKSRWGDLFQKVLNYPTE